MEIKKILLVDDEPDVLDSTKLVLEDAEYEVIGAHSGKDALKILKETPKINLVLIDFFMPDMNGGELAKKIRDDDKFKDLKIAFLTVASKHEVLAVVDMEKLKITNHIPKPYKVEDFLERIKKLLG